MKRNRIIFGILAAVLLAVVVGIAVWRVLSRPTGLTEPIALVDIQPGEFMMGSPEDEEGREEWGTDETLHPVRITYSFKMGKTEVTQKQWREVTGMTIYQQRDKAQVRLGKRLKDVGKTAKATTTRCTL